MSQRWERLEGPFRAMRDHIGGDATAHLVGVNKSTVSRYARGVMEPQNLAMDAIDRALTEYQLRLQHRIPRQ